MKKGVLVVAIITTLIMIAAGILFFYQIHLTPTISDDTIITDENIYEVAEFLGLDASAIGKKYETIEPVTMTVGELREAIVQAKEPAKPIKIEDGDSYMFPDGINDSGYGSVLCYRPISHADFNLIIQADGEYFNNNSVKYLTSIKNGHLEIENFQDSGYYYDFIENPTIKIDLVNAKRADSYFAVTYNATIGKYDAEMKEPIDDINMKGTEIFHMEDILRAVN